jgi:hypothetical protein
VTRPLGGVLLVVATTAVVSAVVVGISVLGTPAAQRQQKLDSARVDDLAAIERLTGRFVILHKELPLDLASLAREPGFAVRTHDPESGVPYDYQILSAESYRLCATFNARSSEPTSFGAPVQPPGTTWAHDSGRQCFTRSAHLPIQRDDIE